jgi:hypothetical protein
MGIQELAWNKLEAMEDKVSVQSHSSLNCLLYILQKHLFNHLSLLLAWICMSLMVWVRIHCYKCVIKQVVLVKWVSKYMKHYWPYGSRRSWSNFNSCYSHVHSQPHGNNHLDLKELVIPNKLQVLWARENWRLVSENFILFVHKQHCSKIEKGVMGHLWTPTRFKSN